MKQSSALKRSKREDFGTSLSGLGVLHIFAAAFDHVINEIFSIHKLDPVAQSEKYG